METASLPSVPGDTRQRSYLCRVSTRQHSAKNPPGRVPMSGSLSSARYGTRQSVLLCWVSETLHSAKNLYRCPGLGSLPSAMVLTLGKEPLCRVLHSAKWPVGTFLFVFYIPSTQTKDITYTSHISHIYITNIITNINSQHKHKYPSQT
jgi:hypothetical protein